MLLHWIWFSGLFLLELLLLYSIPANLITKFPSIQPLIDSFASIAPVIRNFDKVSSHPELLNVYFALTLLLIVPKAIFIYLWLNSNAKTIFRHLVISPLTEQTPRHPSDFVLEPVRAENDRNEKPRGLVSRIFWSLVILIFAGGFLLVYVGLFGREGYDSADVILRRANDPVTLWIDWSVQRTTFVGFFLSVGACILRDYVLWIKRLLQKGCAR